MSYVIVTSTQNVPEDNAGARHTLSVSAPTNTKVLSGGWATDTNDVLESSYPESDGSQWHFVFKGKDVTNGYDVDLSVVCL